jgi:putative transposase
LTLASNVYYKKNPKPELYAEHEQKVLDLHAKIPFYGYRKLHRELKKEYKVILSKKQMRRLMRRLGIKAIRPKKNTSVKHPEHL